MDRLFPWTHSDQVRPPHRWGPPGLAGPSPGVKSALRGVPEHVTKENTEFSNHKRSSARGALRRHTCARGRHTRETQTAACLLLTLGRSFRGEAATRPPRRQTEPQGYAGGSSSPGLSLRTPVSLQMADGSWPPVTRVSPALGTGYVSLCSPKSCRGRPRPGGWWRAPPSGVFLHPGLAWPFTVWCNQSRSGTNWWENRDGPMRSGNAGGGRIFSQGRSPECAQRGAPRGHRGRRQGAVPREAVPRADAPGSTWACAAQGCLRDTRGSARAEPTVSETYTKLPTGTVLGGVWVAFKIRFFVCVRL